jgi:hypothetical protein
MYQRVFLSGVDLFAGLTAAVVLFMARKQTVQRVYILPPLHSVPASPSPALKQDLRRILVQTIDGDSGALSIHKSRVMPGWKRKEVILLNPESKGFYLRLDGVKIWGKDVSEEVAKATLTRELNFSSNPKISRGWVDGPILAR